MIAILGIVTSASPVYTMEETYSYTTSENESGSKNPLLHVNNFKIKVSHGYPAWKPVPNDDPICTAEDLVPVVAGYALLEESDNVEKKQILKMVRNTVGGGTPLTCNYIVKPNSGYRSQVLLQPSRNPTPVFQSIENLFGDLQVAGTACAKIDNKILLIQAILQGCDDRKKNSIYMYKILAACVHDKLGIEISTKLASLTVSHLPECYTSAEDKKLIKQARQKLGEAQQEQSDLALAEEERARPNLTTSCGGLLRSILFTRTKNEELTEQLLEAVAAIRLKNNLRSYLNK